MCEKVNVSQSAGFGAQGNTFIAEQHNHTGLSPADAAQIAFAMFREYFPQLRQEALDEVCRIAERELQKILVEDIERPTPKIAVPLLQNASITEDTDLREMYGKLLAGDMNKKLKPLVHPGFIQIINQLNRDEAKILRYLSKHPIVPTITLRLENPSDQGIDFVENFSNIGEISKCERPLDINKYFVNLMRLGLLQASVHSILVNRTLYEPLKNHDYIISKKKEALKQAPESNFRCSYKCGYVSLTDYGKSFCNVCISSEEVTSQDPPLYNV